jgi:hypothetical protein
MISAEVYLPMVGAFKPPVLEFILKKRQRIKIAIYIS